MIGIRLEMLVGENAEEEEPEPADVALVGTQPHRQHASLLEQGYARSIA